MKNKKVGRPPNKTNIVTVQVNPAVAILSKYLKEGKKVYVEEFGMLEVRKINSRTLYHNKSKKTIKTKANIKVHLTITETLKNYLCNK